VLDPKLSRCEKLSRLFFREQERPDHELISQLVEAREIVHFLVPAPLLDNKEDALICLISDVLGGYISSPQQDMHKWFLITCINRKQFQLAAAEFLNFVYRDQKVDLRAVKKRFCEAELFTTGNLQFS
jgi:GH24 family phage-related lysozyme (muramidase)